jgi:outer membrane protein OmpA-like peptidoglycan-associated protein
VIAKSYRKYPAAQSKSVSVAKSPSERVEKYTEEEKQAVEGIQRVLKLRNVEFKAGRASLTEKGRETVDEIAEVLKKYREVYIEIAGYTDDIGDNADNLRLSIARVRSVKARLISRGIKAARLKTAGYGEMYPLVPNNSEKNRRINRRVEFHIIKGGE